MKDNDIIQAYPDHDPIPMKRFRVEYNPAPCGHPAIRLIAHDRRVICAHCGATLDPFDYLMTEANAIGRAWSEHRIVMAKVKEMRQCVDTMNLEHKRLAASVELLRKEKQKASVFSNTRNPA